MTAIHWFRRDLRINDNPAFNEACKSGNVEMVATSGSLSADKTISWAHSSGVIASCSVQQTASRCSEFVPDQTVIPGFGFSQAVKVTASMAAKAGNKKRRFSTPLD